MMNFNMVNLQCRCPGCQAQFTVDTFAQFQPILDDEGFNKVFCDDCGAKQEADAKSATQQERRRLLTHGIPLEYRDAQAEKVAEHYRDCLTEFPTKLGFTGQSGSGKSSAMACHLLNRGLPFVWVTGNALREITIKAAMDPDNGASALRSVKHTALLAIDDISQPKFTESFATALFDILEERNASRMPIVWTSQKSLKDLRAKIADQCGDNDQADAISRRLGQGAIILSK
jgi:DNA replication protein DnaC